MSYLSKLFVLVRSAALFAPLCSIFFAPSSSAQTNGAEKAAAYRHYPANKIAPQSRLASSPTSANPWLSFLPPDVVPDYDYWSSKQGASAKTAKTRAFTPQSRMTLSAQKNRPFTMLPHLGSSAWQNSSLLIDVEVDLPLPKPLSPLPEDEGSIPLATEISLRSGTAVVINAAIGDGLFGSAGAGSGDLDFFVLRGVSAGQLITVDIDTPEPFGSLDPYLEIRNADGLILAVNDDGDTAESYDSFLRFTAPADGDYFVSVAGYGTYTLSDPFDSSTGLGNIFGEALDEGEYTATFGLDYFDEHSLVFFARPGDVIGAALSGGSQASLSIVDGTKTLRQLSSQNLAALSPDISPLPEGDVSANHVADTFGFYRVNTRSLGRASYSLALSAALPRLASGVRSEVQTIFIDFDGATVDLAESIFKDVPAGEFVTTLSPLSAFLERWGLSAADEDAVIDAIMTVLEQSLVKDVKALGENPRFAIRLLNSRDNPDPFGMANVSRVIVGGTINELLGVRTIGIAQSLDIGNFDTEETAFVLLDLLSADDPFSEVSLNNLVIDPGSNMIDLIGVALGEIVAHEAGHFLGNYHTDEFNPQANLMDQGGNIAFTILGLGSDGIFGSADDVDVRFGRDAYDPEEGLTGIENTLSTIDWGATTSSASSPRLKKSVGGISLKSDAGPLR